MGNETGEAVGLFLLQDGAEAFDLGVAVQVKGAGTGNDVAVQPGGRGQEVPMTPPVKYVRNVTRTSGEKAVLDVVSKASSFGGFGWPCWEGRALLQ